MQKKLTSLRFYLDILKTLIQPLVKKIGKNMKLSNWFALELLNCNAQ